MIDPTAVIHPKAHVQDAHIGARTKVWQFASVIRGAVLGADCNVASGATIDGAKFGDRCIIGQGVALAPGFLFGDDVFLGPNVTICNDRWPRADKIGFDLAPFQDGMFTVVVGDKVSIGAGAIVLPGLVIRAGSMIAAGAIVDKDVPENSLYRRDGTIVALDNRVPLRMRIRAGQVD